MAAHRHRRFVTVDAIGLIGFTVIRCDVAATPGMNPAIVTLAGLRHAHAGPAVPLATQVFTAADSGGAS